MQNLDQATLQQILAMRNAQMRAGGNDSAEWWYDPNKTYDASNFTPPTAPY